MKSFRKNCACKLFVSGLRLKVHLGCSEKEREHAQLVSINIEINFAIPPLAIKTDELGDTVCYAKMVEHIKTCVQSKDFKLIEHLTVCINDVIYAFLCQEGYDSSRVHVVVNKLNSPIPEVYGGVSFSYDVSHEKEKVS